MDSTWFWVLLEMVLVSSGEGCWDEERTALLQLKPFFNSNNHLYSWGENLECCEWVRVECHNITERVTEINLYGANMDREEWYLNASLFSPFQQLHFLDLGDNNIVGCIENEGFEKLSKLSNLKELNLSCNNLNNSILSSLANLSSLKYLYLYDNAFNGALNIKGLTNLEVIDLGGNNLNNSILSSLGGLYSLKYLYLKVIGLNGSVDVQGLYSLKNLEELYMGWNNIDKFVNSKDSGGLKKLNVLSLRGIETTDVSVFLQSTLKSFSSLKTLDISYINNLNGTVITQELHNLITLEELILDGLKLHIGSLQGISTSISLKHLSIRDCELNGTSGSIYFKNLEGLDMEDTVLNISFSQIFKPIISLKELSLSNCGLSGTLYDQGLCEMVHLQELRIGYNNLWGPLPPCLANLTSLKLLDISSNQITGNISSSPLKDLPSIKVLYISNNLFQVPISLYLFFNLSNLKDFKSENNQIYVETMSCSLTPKFQLNSITLSGYGNVGNYPKFLYHQHDLQEVDLSHFNFGGDFPYWLLSNNTQLETLRLVNDSLSGTLILAFQSYMHLRELDISVNLFHGQIPMEIGAKVLKLLSLNISENSFNDSIPSSFGNMRSLLIMDLSNNHLSGGIPEHLATSCFWLELLDLSNNNLQGQVFSNNVNLINLQILQLNGNHFSGNIPESLLNCHSLIGLYLNDNDLSGKIPRWFGNLSYLVDIVMSNNKLEGPIPKELCQVNNLQILDLSKNNISGSFPSCFNLSGIRQIHLSNNRLQGQLKDALYINGSKLLVLDLSYNQFKGNIPSWIGNLSSLGYLILGNNNLEGELPTQLCNLRELRLIDLSQNNLYGKVPSCLYFTALHEGNGNDETLIDSLNGLDIVINARLAMRSEESISFRTKSISYPYKGKILKLLSGIDLSCNKLYGEIPHTIGNLTRIQALNLSNNNLTGSIPTTFSNLKQLESLDLSYNDLSGKIPLDLAEIYTLSFFSVAYNNLSGKAPEMIKQFATFNESSYEGNPFLCGPPLNKSCNPLESPSLTPRVLSGNKEGDNDFVDMDIFYTSFVVTYIVVLLTIVVIFYVNPYWRRTWFYLVEIGMTSCYYFVIDHLP